jgi:Flp pilus assembly protein TadD
MRRNLFICLLLAGITLAIYWPARNYDIVYYDDPLFVTENPEVAAGLGWHSFVWAMTSITAANWHPVTSFSFVLTHQFFGTNPGAEHLVNVFFHAANAVLLFFVLNRMTGATWRSAMVAAIFAWHPLRVESVAWISERKDVLFAFFMLLALWAYARFVELKNQNSKHKQVWYGLALLAFVFGFMSKAMIVTLPFLLLLLDFWPLKRIANEEFRVADFKMLLLEKWPFFALAIFFSALTFWIQKTHAAVVSLENLGLAQRFCNATASCVQYLAEFFWPENLAPIYPYQNNRNVLEILLEALLLLAFSALCVCQLRRRPYLAAGWFWYLGTALPIIGLVQVGGQTMADRYTYLPLIGPTISLVWFVSEWMRSNFSRKILLTSVTIILLAMCVVLTRRQLQFWQNTVSLFEHTVAVTTENTLAQFCLAVGLEHEGRSDEAMIHYRIAMALNPGETQNYKNMAQLLTKQKKWNEAAKLDFAVLEIDPNDLPAHLNLAYILPHLGREQEAMQYLETALQIDPDSTETLNNLAWSLATSEEAGFRNGARAVQLAERACELTDYQKTIFVGTLAAAYAEAGRFEDAISAAEKAINLAQKNGEQELLQKNQELLELYRAHKPYHQASEKLVPGAK